MGVSFSFNFVHTPSNEIDLITHVINVYISRHQRVHIERYNIDIGRSTRIFSTLPKVSVSLLSIPRFC